MLEVLYTVNTAANLVLATAVVTAIVILVRAVRSANPFTTPPKVVDTIEVERPEVRRPVPAPPRGDQQVTAAPMIGSLTLRAWMIHMHPLRDDAWATMVREFYERAAAVPEIADYFRNTDLEQLQRHFTRALMLVSGSGLTVGTVNALRTRHANIRDSAGRPITGEVYDAVISTLVAILVEQGVPREGIAALGESIAPLRDVIVQS